MELTRQQRHLVYTQLLKVVCAEPRVDKGMCHYLIFLLDQDGRMPPHWSWLRGNEKMLLLPELDKHRCSYKGSGYWAALTYKGWEKRIRWIVRAMEDTKP